MIAESVFLSYLKKKDEIQCVFFKSKQSDEISTSRSKVTWSDVLSNMLWTAVGLDGLEGAASEFSLQTAVISPLPFLQKTGCWDPSHGMSGVGSCFFYAKPLSTTFSQLSSQGSVCYVAQGVIFYQPRYSHCICQGLVLVDL